MEKLSTVTIGFFPKCVDEYEYTSLLSFPEGIKTGTFGCFEVVTWKPTVFTCNPVHPHALPPRSHANPVYVSALSQWTSGVGQLSTLSRPFWLVSLCCSAQIRSWESRIQDGVCGKENRQTHKDGQLKTKTKYSKKQHWTERAKMRLESAALLWTGDRTKTTTNKGL